MPGLEAVFCRRETSRGPVCSAVVTAKLPAHADFLLTRQHHVHVSGLLSAITQKPWCDVCLRGVWSLPCLGSIFVTFSRGRGLLQLFWAARRCSRSRGPFFPPRYRCPCRSALSFSRPFGRGRSVASTSVSPSHAVELERIPNCLPHRDRASDRSRDIVPFSFASHGPCDRQVDSCCSTAALSTAKNCPLWWSPPDPERSACSPPHSFEDGRFTVQRGETVGGSPSFRLRGPLKIPIGGPVETLFPGLVSLIVSHDVILSPFAQAFTPLPGWVHAFHSKTTLSQHSGSGNNFRAQWGSTVAQQPAPYDDFSVCHVEPANG